MASHVPTKAVARVTFSSCRHDLFMTTSSTRSLKQAAIAPAVWSAFVLSRLWVAWFVYLGHGQRPFLAPIDGGYAGVGNWWLNAWTLFDSEHFLRIASSGYTPRTAPFFPLYPALLQPFAPHENAMALWGIFISNLALLAMLTILYALSQRDVGARGACIAVWLLAFWPTSAVFSAVYTDALFGAFLLATFWFLRHASWRWAALFATLAALTRNTGFLICGALLLERWHFTQREKNATSPFATVPLLCEKQIPWLTIAAPLLAFLGFQGFLTWRFGGAAGVQNHQLFHRAWMMPWTPLWNEAVNLFVLQKFNVVALLNWTATITALFWTWLDRKRQPLALSFLTVAVMLMQLSLGRTTSPYTNSSLRLLSTTFPYVQNLSRRLGGAQDRVLVKFLLIVFAVIYVLINAAFSYLFGWKKFVIG